MNKFKKIYLEITRNCNLACSFCPCVNNAREEMGSSQFQSVLQKILPYTERITLHLLGEPLVHQEFKKLLEIADQEQASIELTTNGMLLDELKGSLLKSSSLVQINFSLQSFFNNFPNKDWKSYLDSLLSFCDEAERVRPLLYINFRIWDGALREQIVSYIEEYYKTSISRVVDLASIKSKKIRGRIYFHFDSSFVWPSLSLETLGTKGRCYALDKQIGILSNGTVVPCCLDSEGVIALGNIYTQNLTDILSSPRALKMKEGFLQGELVEPLCQRCDFIRRFEK